MSTKKLIADIKPPRGWLSLNFPELWQYRELLFFLTWRDIKVKYKQTLFGFAWAVVVPFTHMVILGTIFGKVAKISSNGLNPYLFYLAATVMWQYFATSLTMSANSLVGNVNLLTKIYLPRIYIPLAACTANLVDFSIAFLILIAMSFIMGIVPASTIFFFPLLLMVTVFTAFGMGLILAALNVKYRDVRIVIPFITQIWMYCSVLLPFSSVPTKIGSVTIGAWRYLYGLNPMAGIIEACRYCLFHHKMVQTEVVEKALAGNVVPETLQAGQAVVVRLMEDGVTTQLFLQDTIESAVTPPWELLAIGLPVSLLLVIFGLHYFKRMESVFADIA